MKIDEPEEAEESFMYSIKYGKTLIDKGLSNRSYGNFLIDERKIEKANEYFSRVIAEFSGDNDRMIYYRATTYERWVRAFEKNSSEYQSVVSKALMEWQKHSNVQRREAEMNRIKSIFTITSP